MIHTLAGVEFKGHTPLNFILSNGERSDHRPYPEEKFPNLRGEISTHLIPKDIEKRIRSVDLHCYFNFICAFCFFDKDRKLISEIGFTCSSEFVRTVLLEENEVIVGVYAGILNADQTKLVHLQFKIASRC